MGFPRNSETYLEVDDMDDMDDMIQLGTNGSS